MTKDLTSGSPLKVILLFSLPLVLGNLFQQFYALADTIIVGRFCGVSALASVGATGSVNYLILGFVIGVCNGFAIPIAQLFHGGILANPDFLPDHQPRGPSATPDEKASELTEAEIESLIQKFAYAAELCMKAGYAGVEVHGAGPFLLPQFVSEETNRRTDRWGGSLENRLRFPLAVLDAVIDVKEKAGQKDFIIGYRITPEQPGEKGITMKETLAAVSEIAKRPIQYLHVSQQNFFHAVRRGADTSKSRMELIHEAVAGRTAVIGAGELVTGADFERAVSSGWTEFAAAGQSVMLNPDLARLVREGRDDLIDRFRDESKNDSYHLPKVLWPWVPDKNGPAKLP